LNTQRQSQVDDTRKNGVQIDVINLFSVAFYEPKKSLYGCE
jgi:hypothetical protein